MAGDTPDLIPIDKSEWEKEFEALAQQLSAREIFANVWFPTGLVRTNPSQLQVDGSEIHLRLPEAKPRVGFCAEICIRAPELGDVREFERGKSQRGEVYLRMEQAYVILELSNSWEFLEFVGNYAPLQ